MNIKPEGLTLPDCQCFNDTKRSVKLNNAIDTFCGLISLAAYKEAIRLDICNKASNYFIAALVSVAINIKMKIDPRKGECFGDKKEDAARLIEELKPLIMQRMDYLDGLVIEMKKKGLI